MENFKSRQVVLSIIGISILILAVVGISYAVFSLTLNGSEDNKLTTGTISMSYLEATNGISIDNAMPISDEEGKNLSGDNEIFDFTISADIAGVTTVHYEISAEKINDYTEQVLDNDIRLYLQRKAGDVYVDTPITSIPKAFTPLEEDSLVGIPAGEMLLYSSEFSNKNSSFNTYSENFRLRMWLGETANVDEVSRSYKVRVNVYSKTL